MELTTTIFAIIAIVIVTGLIWRLSVTESAIAWHSQFASKKECVNFMKYVIGNITAQAQIMCNKIVPH